MASVAELKKSFFAEIDKVENREDLEKLRVKYLGREKGILTAVLRSAGGPPLTEEITIGERVPHPRGLGEGGRVLQCARANKAFANPKS